MRFAGSINRDCEVRRAVRPPGIRFQQACVDSRACPLQAKRCPSLTASVRQSAATRERHPHDVLFHRATRRVGPNVALHRGRLLAKGWLLAATLATSRKQLQFATPCGRFLVSTCWLGRFLFLVRVRKVFRRSEGVCVSHLSRRTR